MKLKRYNQFIVASQIFESKDSEEFRKNIESLKLTLAAMFEPVFKKEREIRDFGNQRLLEEGADNLIEVMFELWAFSVENRQDLEDEIKEEIIEDFHKALISSRDVFINQSYQKGIESSLDILVRNIEAIAKRNSAEDEDWKKPKEISYKDMSKKEINDLLNAALDEGDFERVQLLNKYLESTENFDVDLTREAASEFCEKLVEWITQYLYQSHMN